VGEAPQHEEAGGLVLRPVYQSRTGRNGRCFSACLASLLELPEREVPTFLAPKPSQAEQANRWLEPMGLEYKEFDAGDAAPIGYHVITGISPRGGRHAVVGKDGRIVHDPHPHDGTGRGLVKIDGYGVLTRR
jgi:hypothetical protein